MTTPVQKATKAFAERYNRIVDGEETIDTVTKLKEFWLFGMEQGKNHREMREYIARLMLSAPTSHLVKSFIFSDYALHEAYNELAAFKSTGESPEPNVTDAEYQDRLWENLAWDITQIDETALDEKLQTLLATPQLNQRQIKKFLQAFDIKK